MAEIQPPWIEKPFKLLSRSSQLPLRRLIQNRRQQLVQFSGGFGLQAIESVNCRLQPVQFRSRSSR